MKVLIATAMYPTPEYPVLGTFVRTQVESLKRAGVAVEVLLLDPHARRLKYPKGLLELHRRLASGRFDLVHAHFSYVGALARMQHRVPVAVTYHGDDLLGTINPAGKKTFLSRAAVVGGQLLARLVDAAIVQSEEMARKVRGANVHIIPHEVDLDLFHPIEQARARAELGLDPNKKYLLFAANPQIPVKRFPLAQAAAAQLTARDPSVELLVVYKESQERLALYMSACDVLVFPSYQEGSPNIVKQAMACNMPIVATDVGDVRQIIGNTEGCAICEPSVSAFTERLGAILRVRERTQGRQQVQHLKSADVARRVIAVYDETLRQRARRGYGLRKSL